VNKLVALKAAAVALLLMTILVVIPTATAQDDIAAQVVRAAPDNANCAATPDQILGQAFRSTAGASGETGESGLTPEGEDIAANGLGAAPDWIIQNLQYSPAGAHNVALLVVDDFSLDGSAGNGVSHGYLVYEVLAQMVRLLPPDTAAHIALEQINIADENGYRSDLILAAVQESVDRLSAQGFERFVLNMSFVFIPCHDEEEGFDYADFLDQRAVDPSYSIVEQLGADPAYVEALLVDPSVSFITADALVVDTVMAEAVRSDAVISEQAIIAQPEFQIESEQSNRLQLDAPLLAEAQVETREIDIAQINVAQDAVQSAIADIASEQLQVQLLEGPVFVDEQLQIIDLLQDEQLAFDPLQTYLQANQGRIFAVASAGNFKGIEPLYPARWQEVLAVSANEGNNMRRWMHSNNGAVSVPGAWFLFGDNVYRAGTSFAAPVVSMMLTIDLTQDAPVCGAAGITPELAQGAYDNQPLLDAVSQDC